MLMKYKFYTMIRNTTTQYKKYNDKTAGKPLDLFKLSRVEDGYSAILDPRVSRRL